MFASGEIARRIESAESGLTSSVASHVRAAQPDRDVIVRDLGGGTAAFAGGSPFDKVIGLGFAPLPEDDLAAFEAAVLARGGSVQVELCSMADPSVGRLLGSRGYQQIGYENVLGQPLGAGRSAAPSSDIAVEPARGADLETWLSVMTEGFAHPDVFDGPASHESFEQEAIKQVLRDVAAASGFVPVLARRDGVIVGGASMRLDRGIAQMAGATTLPAHRRKGVQTALLRSRLHHATTEGCDLAVVTTQPGSPSQKNVMREGFALLYVRAIWLKSPPAADQA